MQHLKVLNIFGISYLVMKTFIKVIYSIRCEKITKELQKRLILIKLISSKTHKSLAKLLMKCPSIKLRLKITHQSNLQPAKYQFLNFLNENKYEPNSFTTIAAILVLNKQKNKNILKTAYE